MQEQQYPPVLAQYDIELKPVPFLVQVKNDVVCEPLCRHDMNINELNWLQKLIDRDYLVHLKLDSLPVITRYEGLLNSSIGGYSIGFRVLPTPTGLDVPSSPTQLDEAEYSSAL
eukprot:scaffold9951_cov146-Cylindrotheca_fusiformis.AAC.5